MVVGKKESNPNGLEKYEDAVEGADGKETWAKSVPESPRSGEAFRPQTRYRNRRFVWPWD